MKESYGEGLASHTGPESCAVTCKDQGEALTGVRAGWVLSREITSALWAGPKQKELKTRKREVTHAYLRSVVGTFATMGYRRIGPPCWPSARRSAGCGGRPSGDGVRSTG
jgi:hypothetical protein